MKQFNTGTLVPLLVIFTFLPLFLHAQFASLPYLQTFETGSLDAFWTTTSDDPLGRVQPWNNIAFAAASPIAGNWHLGMDTQPPGNVFTTNEAQLRLNLNGESDVLLQFWWMEWNDETHVQDGIFLSDNNGASYVKVLDLEGSISTDLTWQHFSLDIDALALANGLSLTSTFVIKFQQYDNFYFDGGNDGFFFDNISVTSNLCQVPEISVNDVDLCGPGSVELTATGGGGNYNWYNSENSITPLFTGPTFTTPDLTETTSFFVSESSTETINWDFNSTLEGWASIGECGLTATRWNWNFDGGNRAAFAQDIAGNTSQFLQSPIVDVSGAATADLSFEHRFNTETCCDHGYVVYRLDGGPWLIFTPSVGVYNIFDFMYNDPISGACGNSPDLNVFAGDNGGYQTSSGLIDVLDADELEIAFLFTSDPSFGDEGWYISEVNLDLGCESLRELQTVNVLDQQDGPSTTDATICDGSSATLTASSNTPNGSPVFDWFDAPVGGNFLASGPSFSPAPPNTTTYYVEEQPGGAQTDNEWTFDNDAQGWTLLTQCALPFNWNWESDGGRGTLYATNPNSGNSSMLAISPGVNVNGINAINLSFDHYYNTETCCDHGYVVYRLNGGAWQYFEPEVNTYDIYDFMYNDPIFGGCGFSPDTLVFAGDSGGYITSSGDIDVSSASGFQVGFLWTSDASFMDDGWYLDRVRVVSASTCPTERSSATVYVDNSPPAPSSTDIDICAGFSAVLDAISNSSNPNPVFEWYDAPNGGTLLHRGTPYVSDPPGPVTAYLQEMGAGSRSWTFDNDIEDWTANSECALPSNWEWQDDGGAGSMFAQQTGSGNSSMHLISPELQVTGSELIEIDFNHRYNTETCCDHGYITYRIDGGSWQYLPIADYNIFDFMYNDPFLGNCGFSPDTLVYAGDSGGYFTSTTIADVSGASTFQMGFFFSSDASFVDEGWYIDEVNINGIALQDCTSPRVPVNINFPNLTAPSTTDAEICPPEIGTLTASSNSGTVDPQFEWFDAASNGNLLFTGSDFTPIAPPVNTTNYYAQEILNGEKIWDFDNGSQGWQSFNQCSLPSNWQLVDDGGEQSYFGQQTGSGNSAMSLVSPNLNVSGDVGSVTFSFSHRYNTETCCDHGYVLYRLDGGVWQFFVPEINTYDIFDFMYNDPYFGGCGFSPDTTVFAGDSGGYIESSGEIDVSGASTLQVLFFYSSDASFVDDGWYISEVSISDVVTACASNRTAATLSTTATSDGPTVEDATICPGLIAQLLAETTNNLPDDNLEFNWYDTPVGGAPLFTGNPFMAGPATTSTFYAEEISSGDVIYNFDNGFEGWTATAECDLPANWEPVMDQDRTTLFAQQEGSGNSSMFLKSPVIPLDGQFSISYNFTHRFNTETCCDHGYVVARRDSGPWFQLNPTTNPYNIFDFMYNDPIMGNCGFSPDMNVYAGDSGPYITSSGFLFVNGFSNVEFGFLYTSDASFVDEGWYIDQFRVNNIYNGCVSDRTPVTVTVETLPAPTAANGSTCAGGSATLLASSNSNVPGTEFEWYDAPAAGNLLYRGNPFFTPPVPGPTSFWVQEISPAATQVTDNFDGGFDPAVWGLVQGGSADQICGSASGDALRFSTAGTRLARTQQLDVNGGGELNFYLKISGELTAGCEAAEPGEDVVLEYSIGGPYTIISTYNEASYPNFTLISEQIPIGAQGPNTIFRFRQLTNSGTDFDVWAIDDFSVDAIATNFCEGPRTQVDVTIDQLPAPLVVGDDICPGETASVTATSNSGFPNPVFEYWSAPAGGIFMGSGNPFTPSPVSTTTYYAQERSQSNRFWNFNTDLEDWTATAECGLPFNWEWNSDGGAGAAYATNPNSGNTSMTLNSPAVTVAGAASVNFSFSHRYNTETCCDHGYVVYRLDGGPWEMFVPATNTYNIFDFMYNDPIFGGCGFSPDTTVYAGDSGGYLSSSGTIETSGSTELELAFVWSSDASFRDDGWYINSAAITGLGNGCVSSRTPVTVTVGNPAAPIAGSTPTCVGGMSELTASATSGNLSPSFEWYDSEFGGTLLSLDNPYTSQPILSPTSFWVQEVVDGIPFSFSDNFNAGTNPDLWGLIQAGQPDATCGSVTGTALRFNGAGTRLARTNILDVGSGGSIDFYLRISNTATVGCEAAEPGEDVVLEYSIGGPYVIISTYDQDSYSSFTQINELIPPGAQTGNTIFRLRQLTNSGLDFDVWAIDDFFISAVGGQLCSSARTEVIVTPTLLPGPTVLSPNICQGTPANLNAVSNAALTSTEFEWYDAAVGGTLLFTGNPYQPSPLTNTTYYVQEVDPFVKNWTFDADLEGWLASPGCGLTENWVWASDGGQGSLYATNPGGGNTSQLVRSGPIDASGTNSVDFSFNHRYNTETCCDHGYAVYRLDGGPWEMFIPDVNTYNIFDFMYNDPILGGCGFSPDTTVYAGDSGGYFTSSGTIISGAANTVEVGFLFTTDASFVDDGWYIDEVTVSGLGDGCITARTPVPVEVRPCCPPLAAFDYTPNNSTVVLSQYCYLDPNDDVIHFHSNLTASRLLFSMSNLDLSGGSPIVTLEQVGAPTQNTPSPPNCNVGTTPPDVFFEMERAWDVDLNGAIVRPGGSDIRFYYPPVEATNLQTMVNNFMSVYAACNYQLGDVEWFKNSNGAMYMQGDYDGTQTQVETFASATYGTVSNNINFVELNLPNFSGGALGTRVLNSGPLLSVELVDFNAEKYDESSSLLTWRTETELNNDFFGVERSQDGFNFREIGQVEGAGTTDVPIDYELIDETPEQGDNYYRLRIVDTDGTFTYSDVKLVRFDLEFTAEVRPNPFINKFELVIISDVETDAAIRVFDLLGRQLEQREVSITSGQSIVSFNTSDGRWAAGVYIVDLMTTDKQHTQWKIVKAE